MRRAVAAVAPRFDEACTPQRHELTAISSSWPGTADSPLILPARLACTDKKMSPDPADAGLPGMPVLR